MAVSGTSFKPGQSGNKSGRPGRVAEFNRKLGQYADRTIQGCKDKSYDDVIVEYILKVATESQSFNERKWAIQFYVERRYGKPQESQENETTDETKEIKLPKVGLKIAE